MKLFMTQENLTKFGLHASNKKYNTQNEEWMYIKLYVLLCIYTFPYIICNEKYTDKKLQIFRNVIQIQG